MVNSDNGDGYQAIVNDLKTLWGVVQGNPAAWGRVVASLKSASTTTGGLSNTAVGMDNTVSGVYTQFQAVSVGWSAFKLEGKTLPEWLADRESKLATGGTKGRFGRITGGRTIEGKADAVYNAVFPNGTLNLLAGLNPASTVNTRFEGLEGELDPLKKDVGEAVSKAGAADSASTAAKSTADGAVTTAEGAVLKAEAAETKSTTASDQAAAGRRTAGEALGKAATALTKVETAFKKADGATSQAYKAMNRLEAFEKRVDKTASENTTAFKALEKSVAEITARLGE